VDDLVTCGLTACRPALGNEYGKPLPFTFTGRGAKYFDQHVCVWLSVCLLAHLKSHAAFSRLGLEPVTGWSQIYRSTRCATWTCFIVSQKPHVLTTPYFLHVAVAWSATAGYVMYFCGFVNDVTYTSKWPESETTRTFRRVHYVAAPVGRQTTLCLEAESAISNCNVLFFRHDKTDALFFHQT